MANYTSHDSINCRMLCLIYSDLAFCLGQNRKPRKVKKHITVSKEANINYEN